MVRITTPEISEHDNLILMMAKYFQQLGYIDIKADIPGWTRPDFIYWKNNPNNRYFPDLTCRDTYGTFVVLEAETCSTLNDQHTRDQFTIFRAHANNLQGRFEVVVPRSCSGSDGRQLITQYAANWNISLDNVWTPSN